MSPSRPSFFLCHVVLAALLLNAWPSSAQQALPVPPPPAKDTGSKPGAVKDKGAVNVPMLDEPPSLTLPLPKITAPAEAGKTSPPTKGVESVPLPALRPVAPMVGTPNPQASASSTSELGQFVIHGADLESRTAINKICEETAAQMSQLLRDTERFEIPIVIAIKTPPNVSPNGPAVTTDFAQLAFGGFRMQITIQVRPDFNVADFRDELVRMLIAERILRGHKEVTSTRANILPDWLLVGVKEAMHYRTRSRPSAVFAAVFRTGKVYGIEEILETAPGSLDALSRTLYETSCCALVLALIDQPDGNLRMAKFLNALASDSKSDREMLNKSFPGINASKNSLNKWWSLQMASLATPSVFETLGPSETAKELDQALMIHYETTPADAPVARVASADEETLKADAETEAKKRGFFGRLFTGDKAGKPVAEEAPAKEPEQTAASKPKPELEPVVTKTEKPEPVVTKTAKPRATPKKKDPVIVTEEPAPEVNTAPAKTGFRIRNLLGFGSNSTPEEEKPEPKKEDKPKPEPKKEDKPKPEPKKEDKPTPEPKKEDKPKPEPKKEDKPKPEPKKEDTPEPAADEGEKKAGFFGRMFGGKKEEKPAERFESEQPKEEKTKAKGKKSTPEDKPSASVFDPSLMLRMAADITVPSLNFALDSAAWWQSDSPRYVAFLGFGKKKDKPAEGEESAPTEEKKQEPEPKPKKSEEPKAEPKAKAKPKKERLISVSIPLSDYSRIMKRSDAKKILTATATNITALTTRAHPLFRPLIKEYADLVVEIATHKAKDADARLKELRIRRDQVLAQAKAVRDYLDYFEASVSSDYSGLFDDYLRLPKTIDKEIPRRADPISKILDEAEKQAGK